MSVKIMLDAGHYGSYQNMSPCTVNPTYYESNMTWTLHLMLQEELRKYGFIVGTTRSNKERDLPVFERGQMAEGYDMFISMHSNAVSNAVYDGIDRPVVIYPIIDNDAQKAFAAEIGQTVHDVMQTKQQYQIMTREYPNISTLDYYGVIRGAVSVGCKHAYIVEHGFHTDTYCTRWLSNESNLRRLAAAEAKLIADYYGVKMIKAQEDNTIYRVQVGAFSLRNNARDMLTKLTEAGFNGFIVSEKK